MSAVDDLMNVGTTIDITGGSEKMTNSISNDEQVIDATSSSGPKSIRLGGSGVLQQASVRPKRKTIVSGTVDSEGKVSTSTDTSNFARRMVNMSDIPVKKEAPDPNVHKSLQEDILVGENSPFGKYKRRKTEEMEEWIANKEEEAEMAAMEGKEVKPLKGNVPAEDYLFDTSGFAHKEKPVTEETEIDGMMSSDDNEVNNNNKSNDEFEFNDDETMDSIEDQDIKEEFEELDVQLDNINLEDDDNWVDNVADNMKDENNNVESVDNSEDEEYMDEEEVEEADEEQEEKEIVPEPKPEPKKEVKKPEKPVTYSAELDMDIEEDNSNTKKEDTNEDDDPLDNELVDESSTDITDEELSKLKKIATEKLKPVSSRLDLKTFTILKKPAAANSKESRVMKAKVAKWILPVQESIVKMREFSGVELEMLRSYTESNSYDNMKARFQLIYDHIVSNKPDTFEQWCRTTPTQDLDHYYFAIYIANFNGANYLPRTCQKCGETYITDNHDIMDMVKFDSKEARKKYLGIYKSNIENPAKGIYASEIVPVSEHLAIGIRNSVLQDFLDNALISTTVRTQYANVVNLIPFIDAMYVIDMDTQTLAPMVYKEYKDNPQKSLYSKIRVINNEFKNLSADEFGIIEPYVTELSTIKVDMHYVDPSTSCPKCSTQSEESTMPAEALVFTRYQLSALVTTSLK